MINPLPAHVYNRAKVDAFKLQSAGQATKSSGGGRRAHQATRGEEGGHG